MTEQFAGTSTFLFTDIESSTSRWAEDRVAMAEALRVHDEAMAAAIAAHDGRLFKHTGDGVGAAFGSARQALEAAIAAQATAGLPVRMGLHTGEAQARDGDFFGPTVNRCARVMDAGHGGQILLSATTAALLEGVELLDLGEHVLKGLPAPERILQFGRDRFPPLRVAAQASTLPPQRSTLVGRDALVDDVAGRLAPGRVVTLVGVGGVGKTRLAVAAAEVVADRFDRVAFVDLATVSDGIEVLPALARALELTMATRDAVAVALTGRTVLLVLDNCEHVLGDAADLVEDVLEDSPTVSVLATSREGLALDGEHLVAVPGLDSEDGDSPGVSLFLGRAEQATSGFALDPGDRPTVVEICRRLDGIPLAIELAAARTSVLSVRELADRLDRRFQVLTGGRRRRSRDRHRTLRETVDWSFDLLDEDEQEVFTRLGVFAGSFDLAGAVAVVGDRGEIEVLDLVAALVDKSLLTVVLGVGAPRYRYLETIRSYAEEKLDQSDGSPEVVARLHAHEVERLTGITQEREPSYWLVDELPNIRRAFDDAIDRQDVSGTTALVAPFLDVASQVPWISGWGDEVLALPAATGSREEPVLRSARVHDAWMAGRFGELRDLADELLAVMARWPIEELPSVLLVQLGVVHSLIGDDRAAAGFYERWSAGFDDPGTALSRRLGEQEFRLSSRFPRYPVLAGLDGDIAEGLRSGSWVIRGHAHRLAVFQALERGDFEAMLQSARSVEQLSVEPSLSWFWGLQHQARAELGLGRLEEALHLADQNLDRAQRCGDGHAMVIPTAVFALVLQALDEPEAAAVVRALLPRRLTLLYVDELAALDAWLEAHLSSDARAALRAEGRAKSPIELQVLTHEVAGRHGIARSGA